MHEIKHQPPNGAMAEAERFLRQQQERVCPPLRSPEVTSAPTPGNFKVGASRGATQRPQNSVADLADRGGFDN